MSKVFFNPQIKKAINGIEKIPVFKYDFCKFSDCNENKIHRDNTIYLSEMFKKFQKNKDYYDTFIKEFLYESKIGDRDLSDALDGTWTRWKKDLGPDYYPMGFLIMLCFRDLNAIIQYNIVNTPNNLLKKIYSKSLKNLRKFRKENGIIDYIPFK